MNRPRVTVVGLGPAGEGYIGVGTLDLLRAAPAAFLRTSRHPSAALAGDIPSFDHVYERAATFEEVYERITEELVAAAGRVRDEGPVVYAVPGSPLVAERTVELLRADERVDITVVPSLSFLDLAWERLGIDPLTAGVRLVDGARFITEAAGERGPLLVAQCWSKPVLSDIKLSLETDSGEAPSVTVLHHLGLDDEVVTTVAWDELDRTLEPDHLTSLWIPLLTAPVAAELMDLVELVRRLRADCPWDAKQTHASLTRHLLEESYEAIDAIEELTRAEAGEGDEAVAVTHLEEELGDVLFQVVFHATLASEEGRFTLADVARGVHDKLVSRHPHVFGDVVADSPEAVVANWEVIKQAEKQRESVTDGIPLALPALALATKLQRKASAIGVSADGAGDDATQWRALVEALTSIPSSQGLGSAQPADTLEVDTTAARAYGELLLEVADLGRRRGIDPEGALREAALRLRDEIVEAEQRGRSESD